MIRKLYNPEAYSKNIFKPLQFASGGILSSNSKTIKEYSIVAEGDVLGFTYVNESGEDVPVIFEGGASGNMVEGIKKLLQQSIQIHGYVANKEDVGYRGNGIDVYENNDGFVIKIAGEMIIKYINVESENQAVTVKTNRSAVDILQFELPVDTNPGLMSLGGAVGTQIGVVEGYSTGVSTNSVAVAYETAAATQGLVLNCVFVHEINSVFKISIHAFSNNFTCDGNEGTRLDSYPGFKD